MLRIKKIMCRGGIYMDDTIKIVGIGLLALILIIVIKQYRPEFALYISLIAGVFIWL